MLAVYCRISQEKLEGKDRSINDQKLLGIELAKSLNLSYKIYADIGISGTKKIEDRPAFASMLDDISDGEITRVFVFDQSRLERSPETRFILKKLFKENDILLYTNNGLVDTDSDEGEMMGDFLSIINQYYARITSRKIKSVLKRNTQNGKAHAKVMPFGYMKDDKGYLVIDPKEEPIVKEVYEKALSGIGSSTIKHWLIKEGVLTRYNKMEGTLTITNKYTGIKTVKEKKDIIWSDKQVQDMLRNPIYKGKRKWKNQYYDCPAIFSPTYWDEVQIQLERNSRSKKTGKNVDHKYLLKGLLECNQCNSNYYGRKRPNRSDNFYMCSSKRYKENKCKNRSINIDVLEKFIWELMYRDKLYTKVKDTFQREETECRRVELKNKISQQNKSIEKLKKQLQKAIELVLAGVVTESEILHSKKRIDSEEKKLKEILERDREEISQLENQTIIIEELSVDWGYLEENTFVNTKKQQQILERGIHYKTSYNDKKNILKKYIKRIFIDYNYNTRIYTVTVTYNLPIPDENYLIDFNYIACYHVEDKKLDQWFVDYGKRFTRKKVVDTIGGLTGIKMPLESYGDTNLSSMVNHMISENDRSIDAYFKSEEYKRKMKGAGSLGKKA